MIRFFQHGALVLAFLGISLVQKVDVDWKVHPSGSVWESHSPSAQCTEIVLPPLPKRAGWLAKQVLPRTQPASPFEGAEADFYVVTGYAVGDAHTPGRVTADGRLVRPGITVACPVELMLGTALYIKGFGVRICEDRGGMIVGKRLDIAFETPEAAMMFGKRRLAVAVIR